MVSFVVAVTLQDKTRLSTYFTQSPPQLRTFQYTVNPPESHHTFFENGTYRPSRGGFEVFLFELLSTTNTIYPHQVTSGRPSEIDSFVFARKTSNTSEDGKPLDSSKDVRQSFEWPLDLAKGHTLSMAGLATPKRFRLLDCDAYQKKIIRIVEWSALEIAQEYNTISYVWKGNRTSPVEKSFAVEGATDCDRVDVDLLGSACMRTKSFLWLDKLCIIQTDKEDKMWQIQNMATIYKNCKRCLVLMGGLGGLGRLDDKTSWLNRSWTLQEALLPRRISVMFEWTHGSGTLFSSAQQEFIYSRDGRYATKNLVDLIHFSTGGSIRFLPSTQEALKEEIPATALSNVRPLVCVLEGRGVLDVAEESRNSQSVAEFETMVWRNAMLRTSTRELDTVFSIMGLFGVQLDPSLYKTQSQALIALIQETMKKGGRATWLTTSTVTPGLLPLLPVSDNQELPSVMISDKLVEAPPLVENLNWYLRCAPKGTLDDNGALTIFAPFSSVKITVGQPDHSYQDFRLKGTMEGQEIRLSGAAGTHAVSLGEIEHIELGVDPCFQYPPTVVALLLERTGDRWTKVGVAGLPASLTKNWKKERLIIVGKDDDPLY